MRYNYLTESHRSRHNQSRIWNIEEGEENDIRIIKKDWFENKWYWVGAIAGIVLSLVIFNRKQ